MPETLWREAVELVGERSCFAVARELGLSYANLRARAEGGESATTPVARAAPPGFAQLDLGALFSGSGGSGTQIVVRRADGTRLSVRLAAGERLAAEDLRELVSAFVQGGAR